MLRIVNFHFINIEIDIPNRLTIFNIDIIKKPHVKISTVDVVSITISAAES